MDKARHMLDIPLGPHQCACHNNPAFPFLSYCTRHTHHYCCVFLPFLLTSLSFLYLDMLALHDTCSRVLPGRITICFLHFGIFFWFIENPSCFSICKTTRSKIIPYLCYWISSCNTIRFCFCIPLSSFKCFKLNTISLHIFHPPSKPVMDFSGFIVLNPKLSPFISLWYVRSLGNHPLILHVLHFVMHQWIWIVKDPLFLAALGARVVRVLVL